MLKRCLGGICIVSTAFIASGVQAQGHRSAWMWSTSSHPYGAFNIVGDPVAETNLIRDFELWGFDRIATSLNARPATEPNAVANWNARLDDAGIEAQSLLGDPSWILPGERRNSLLSKIQTWVIDFNASRTDPRERFDAVHLDLEPHAIGDQWKNGTNTDRRDLLLMLRDTYADVRNLLDANGQSDVKLYGDQPVWFDDGSNITWDPGEYDQWMQDISESLDGLTLMAFERPLLSIIVDSVQTEFEKFDGEFRIGLAANAVGEGKTWSTFQELTDMADALEAYYGPALSGIDFQPLNVWADLVDHATQIPEVIGDVSYDGYVGLDDLDIVLHAWDQDVTPGSPPDPSGDGHVDSEDLNVILAHWNEGDRVTPIVVTVVPEPTVAGLFLVMAVGGLRRSR